MAVCLSEEFTDEKDDGCCAVTGDIVLSGSSAGDHDLKKVHI